MNMITLSKELGVEVKDIKKVVDKHHSSNLTDTEVKEIRKALGSKEVLNVSETPKEPETIEVLEDVECYTCFEQNDKTPLQILVFGE